MSDRPLTRRGKKHRVFEARYQKADAEGVRQSRYLTALVAEKDAFDEQVYI